jgi:hypothetical protein
MSRFGFPELTITLVVIAMMLVVVLPAARICRRVGYPAALGILAVVPLANVVLLWFIAFAEWPARRNAAL